MNEVDEILPRTTNTTTTTIPNNQTALLLSQDELMINNNNTNNDGDVGHDLSGGGGGSGSGLSNGNRHHNMDCNETEGDEEGNNTISVDDAIDRLGCGKFQNVVLLSAGLCFAADAMEVTVLSFLSSILKYEWKLSSTEAAGITSCVFVGQILGTIVLGRLGDGIGRRPVFLIAAAFISIFGILTAFATNYITLLIMRTAVGFGVGGLVVPFDILAEFLPAEQRGKYLLYVQYSWTFGSMSVPIIAYLSIGRGHSWNLFVFLCALPCLVSGIVGLFYVPESPRWLLSSGRNDEAIDILRSAALMNGKNPDELYPKLRTVVREEIHEKEKGFRDLFTRKWRRITLFIWGAWIGFAYGYYGTILIVTRVFENDNNNNNGGNTMPTFDYISIFISCSAELVGATIVIFLIDRVGRIIPQVISYILGGFLVFVLSITARWNNAVFSTFVAFITRMFEMCSTCLTWISTAEIYTTEIRTTGHSSANAVARLSAFFSPFLVQEQRIRLEYVGVIMLGIHIFTALCASRLPETKGLALSEIQCGNDTYDDVGDGDDNDNNNGNDNCIIGASTSYLPLDDDDDDDDCTNDKKKGGSFSARTMILESSRGDCQSLT